MNHKREMLEGPNGTGTGKAEVGEVDLRVLSHPGLHAGLHGETLS